MSTKTLNLTLAFEVGQRVKVRGQDLEVTVRWVRWDGNELDYWVTWWDDGSRKDVVVRADELERVNG